MSFQSADGRVFAGRELVMPPGLQGTWVVRVEVVSRGIPEGAVFEIERHCMQFSHRPQMDNPKALAYMTLESDDATDREAEDLREPLSGEMFHYLVRAENGCGVGSIGADSEGYARRPARDCGP